MTTELVWLGVAPGGEPPEAWERADADAVLRVALRYRVAIRLILGDEPAGVALRVLRTPADRAIPYEVACVYAPADPEAVAYADRCRRFTPDTWAAAGLTAPEPGRGRG
jgi:hypothetical protein